MKNYLEVIDMIHEMKLKENPFERIKNGTKTIEFRLYDEKRRKIKIGDEIKFSKLPDLQEQLIVEVLDMYRDYTFEKLFSKIYTDRNEVEEKTKIMNQYYSHEQEKEYGVVGIKIKVLKNNFKYNYNKLVRNKIPENIDSDQRKKSKYRILNDNEYIDELNKKIIEEANEFIEKDSIEELGDLMEVIRAIMKFKGYNMQKVEENMEAKAKEKGTFSNRIFLEYVEEENRNIEEEKELKKNFRKD